MFFVFPFESDMNILAGVGLYQIAFQFVLNANFQSQQLNSSNAKLPRSFNPLACSDIQKSPSYMTENELLSSIKQAVYPL